MSDLQLVSLFDGIAGFPQAFATAGVRTVATVEIDKAAAGVAAEHFPDAAHFNDVTKVRGGADDSSAQGGHLVAHALTAEGFDASEDETGRGTPIVPVDLAQVTSKENRSNPRPGDPNGSLAATSRPAVAFTLGAEPGSGTGHDTNFLPMAFGHTNGLDVQASTEITPTLRTANGAGGGSALTWQGGSTQDQVVGPDAVSPTLAHASNAHGGHHQPKVMMQAVVRRLTPVECERLQGYPDGWTAVSAGKAQADSARYRQLGNSIAVPVFAWVARRIVAVDEAGS